MDTPHSKKVTSAYEPRAPSLKQVIILILSFFIFPVNISDFFVSLSLLPCDRSYKKIQETYPNVKHHKDSTASWAAQQS